METLGQRLQRLREANGLSIREAADRVGVAVSTYRDWEQGRAIKGEPYVKMAETFRVSVFYLLTGEQSRRSDLAKAVELLNTAIEFIMKYDQSV